MTDILSYLPNIPLHRNYWFMRTTGGSYYNEFKEGNYIGIAWNKITTSELERLVSTLPERELSDKIAELVKVNYPTISQPRRVGNQLIRFAKSLKQNDIVLIPSSGSQYIQFGEIQSEDIYASESNSRKNTSLAPLFKRKKVKWLKEVQRDRLQLEMYRAVHPQQALTNLHAYAEAIDSTLHDFYIKGDKAYMSLEIQQNAGINAVELFSMGLNTLQLIPKFSAFSDNSFSVDAIQTKVHIQSPGKIKLIGPIISLGLLALLVISVTGGDANIQLGANDTIHLQSPGIVQSIINYENSQADRADKEKLVEAFTHLKVKTPSDVVKAIQAIQDSSQNESTNNTTNSNQSTTNDTQGGQ